jgi:hypothetical protein
LMVFITIICLLFLHTLSLQLSLLFFFVGMADPFAAQQSVFVTTSQ